MAETNPKKPWIAVILSFKTLSLLAEPPSVVLNDVNPSMIVIGADTPPELAVCKFIVVNVELSVVSDTFTFQITAYASTVPLSESAISILFLYASK